MNDFDYLNATWDEFLRVWPRERLATMTLDEYTRAGSKDSFTYWIESRLDKIGSIWGGSSFKFGVYSRKDVEEKASGGKLRYSENYAWYSSLGVTADEAFEKVRGNVVEVARLGAIGDLKAIEAFDRLGTAFKWKIAFHYQDRQNPVIVAVFKRSLLAAGLGASSQKGMAELQAEAIARRPPDLGLIQFSKEIWERGNGSDTQSDDEEISSDSGRGRRASADLFSDPDRQFWFVGAAWGENDRSEQFLAEGIWKNGYEDKFVDKVVLMKPGDKIAIKSTFVKKLNLPFDNRGKHVSCMRIKAIGTITKNHGDGQTVNVDWVRLDPPRDWYFYTYLVTVSQADRDDDLARRLILFAFCDAKQDYDFWLAVPYFAAKYGCQASDVPADEDDDALQAELEQAVLAPTYTLNSISEEGCFIETSGLELALSRLKAKKNLILQGPPGAGKTWLAKKLAYALIGTKDRKVTKDRLRSVQFHPSSCYEDFVRGWRPADDGKLKLVDGVFLEMAHAAAAEPDRPFVLIIEEINRGNPAQIFGELLTLLENTKRNQEDAVELVYRRKVGERIYIPKNLHVIGTMNIADRSLALVDLALRRRFAFFNLEPQFNGLWRKWCSAKFAFSEADIDLIAAKMMKLNEEIAGDRSLGAQFRVGHSFVTPSEGASIADVRHWFAEIVDTELGPLLHEYWYDAPDRAAAVIAALKSGV